MNVLATPVRRLDSVRLVEVVPAILNKEQAPSIIVAEVPPILIASFGSFRKASSENCHACPSQPPPAQYSLLQMHGQLAAHPWDAAGWFRSARATPAVARPGHKRLVDFS